MYSFFCEICEHLVQCSSAVSPFVVPLRAGFVVSLIAYHFSFASFRQGGIVCDGRIFSIFSGISFVTLCTIDSLNLLGMPSFLFISFLGRGGVGVVCLLLLLHSWIGSHLWIGFVGLILTASCAAAHCFMWFSHI